MRISMALWGLGVLLTVASAVAQAQPAPGSTGPVPQIQVPPQQPPAPPPPVQPPGRPPPTPGGQPVPSEPPPPPGAGLPPHPPLGLGPGLPGDPLLRLIAERRPELAQRLEQLRRRSPERFRAVLLDALTTR